jgi:hypothetical protein
LQDKRKEILNLFAHESLLSKGAIRRTRPYLDDFFEILENPKRVQKRILDDCR